MKHGTAVDWSFLIMEVLLFQDYDPDLPPELAAAAGLHDVSVENSHLGKTDSGQMDLSGQGRGATRTRPQLVCLDLHVYLAPFFVVSSSI